LRLSGLASNVRAMKRCLVAMLLVLGAAPLVAQRVPRRPRLPAGADTNDAIAYFQFGLSRVELDPSQGEAAFYWAARLDPMSPQAQYALGIARLLKDKGRLIRYEQNDLPVLALPAVRAIDSLRFRAEMIDPFFHRGMDELLLFAWAKEAAHSTDAFLGTSSSAGSGALEGNRTVGATSTGSNNSGGIAIATEQFLRENDPYALGQLHYSRGELREALQLWSAAQHTLAQDMVWQERARAFAELRQLDSASAMMTAALRHRRGANDDPTLHVYQTIAAWEFARGRVLEDLRDTAGAREAYERSLGSDDNYYPALLALGRLALQQRDTANAAGAIRRAIDRPDVQFFACTVAATVLDRLGRHDAAVAALRKATQMEPFAPAGWLLLARSLESPRDSAGATAAYQQYLTLAARNDPSRMLATQALARLHGTAP
jgi:tetratricopeptide (TPR) repeat protein